MGIELSTSDLPMFFSAEHFALAETLSREITPDDKALHDPERVVKRMAALGLLRYVHPASGKERVDVRALCLVREALGQVSSLADGVLAVQGLGSHSLVLTPDATDRAVVLARVQNGELTVGFALTEPEAGSDVRSLKTTARLDGEEWILDGEKIFISNVGIAQAFTVFARVEPAPANGKAVSAFWVPKQSIGLELEPMRLAGGADHPIGRLRMKECRIAKHALLGQVGGGMRLGLGTLDVFRTSVGAAAVGMGRRAIAESIAHVKKRTQFGKRLADFQLTQAALADMVTDLDAARLLVYRAAWDKDTNKGDRKSAQPVAMAKMFATEAASRIIDRAVQLHGGMGVMEGSVVADLQRDVRPLRIYEGTTEIQKLIIGGELTAP